MALRLKHILALVMGMLTLGSCNKSTPQDTPPVEALLFPLEVYIRVTDSSGNDLLEREDVGSGASDFVTLEYNGTTFTPRERSGTRAVSYTFYGLNTYRVALSNGTSIRILNFGQFPIDENGDYTMTLRWRGGGQDVIRVVNRFQWTDLNQTQYSQSTQYYLNGQPITAQQATPYTFVK